MSEEKGVYKIYDNDDVVELPEVPYEPYEIRISVRDFETKYVSRQAFDALQAENVILHDRCEVLQGAWTTRNGIAEKLEAENATLKAELAIWRKETKWGGEK